MLYSWIISHARFANALQLITRVFLTRKVQIELNLIPITFHLVLLLLSVCKSCFSWYTSDNEPSETRATSCYGTIFPMPNIKFLFLDNCYTGIMFHVNWINLSLNLVLYILYPVGGDLTVGSGSGDMLEGSSPPILTTLTPNTIVLDSAAEVWCHAYMSIEFSYFRDHIV